MSYNKVIYAGETLVDLTEDSVTPSTLAVGVTAHNAAGETIVGTCMTSANDFTDEHKTKLEGIEEGANNYTLPEQGVGTEHIADGAVTASKLSSDAFSSIGKSFVVTLAADGWASNQQTVAAEGVTDTNTVIVAADPASENYAEYADNEVRGVAQAAGTLTFTCSSVPSIALRVNVTVLNL